MKFVATFTVLLLCLSCQGQVFDDYDEGIGDVVHMIKITIDMLYEQKEKMISLEEHLKNLTASHEDQNRKMISLEDTLRSGLQNMTEIFHNSSAIDECIDGSHLCSEFAQCQCHEGYSGDGFQCHEIDECKEGNPCHPGAECHNMVGSYSCTCNQPYEGDGHTCEFNCRDSFGGELVEDLGCLTLVKTGKTWEASKKHCETRGMQLLEDIPSRQHFRFIWNAFKHNSPMWVGAKGRKWLSTGEDIASNLYQKGQPDGGSSQCIYFYSRREADKYEGLVDSSCTATTYSLCQVPLPSH